MPTQAQAGSSEMVEAVLNPPDPSIEENCTKTYIVKERTGFAELRFYPQSGKLTLCCTMVKARLSLKLYIISKYREALQAFIGLVKGMLVKPA